MSPNPKFEIRNSKSEANSKYQIRNPKRRVCFGFRALNLFRISDFGFRISDLVRLYRNLFVRFRGKTGAGLGELDMILVNLGGNAAIVEPGPDLFLDGALAHAAAARG